jgi:hypothetical protein
MLTLLKNILLSRNSSPDGGLPSLPTTFNASQLTANAEVINRLVQEQTSRSLVQTGGKTLETLVLGFIVPVIFNLAPGLPDRLYQDRGCPLGRLPGLLGRCPVCHLQTYAADLPAHTARGGRHDHRTGADPLPAGPGPVQPLERCLPV